MSAATTVRPALAGDAEELAELHLRVWEEAYAALVDPAVLEARRARPRCEREAGWRSRLRSTPTWVAAADDGRIVGFVQAGAGRDADPGLPPTELMALYVLAEVYGTGAGRALLDAALGRGAAYLWVLDGNHRARRFYERQGFEVDGAGRSDEVGSESRMVRR